MFAILFLTESLNSKKAYRLMNEKKNSLNKWIDEQKTLNPIAKI